ncbi:hypothetical protein [Cognataquiflexum aquatile]|jgi:hypothetical protein|uniref:hypothetical protein n=1 Tax=Cognataquiflexum aquatile TaxID=2249427 RepID=UPI0013006DAE|nr:hypothetical protein [Cognataquiflexum aquatile]
MLTKLLLPYRLKFIGLALLLPMTLLLILSGVHEYELSWLTWDGFRKTGDLFYGSDENFTYEFAYIGTFLSMFLIAFSKEKIEDEYIQKLRLDSLLLAFYLYSLISILGTLVFYSFDYLLFMGYNTFSLQLVFIIRFRWVMYRQQETLTLI